MDTDKHIFSEVISAFALHIAAPNYKLSIG
jgi:hypothetical protein